MHQGDFLEAVADGLRASTAGLQSRAEVVRSGPAP